jgi:predicted phosphodiesterase
VVLGPFPSAVGAPELRRFGVVGDVHTQAAALQAMLAFYATAELDAVLCCGDVLDGAGDPLRCVQLLSEHSCFVTRGNHERWAATAMMRDWDAPRLADLPSAVGEWVGRLPMTLRFTSPAGVVEMAHGIGTDDMNQLRSGAHGKALETNVAWQELLVSGRAQVVVKGHTHQREVFFKDGVVVVDGGTLLGYGPPGGVMVDLDARRYAMVEVNGPAVTQAPWAALPSADTLSQVPPDMAGQVPPAPAEDNKAKHGFLAGLLGRRPGRALG